jgi:hypothetical protein
MVSKPVEKSTLIYRFGKAGYWHDLTKFCLYILLRPIIFVSEKVKLKLIIY